MISSIICFFFGHKWNPGIYGIRDKTGIEYFNAKRCKRCGKVKRDK